jgi:hypothetical protein
MCTKCWDYVILGKKKPVIILNINRLIFVGEMEFVLCEVGIEFFVSNLG